MIDSNLVLSVIRDFYMKQKAPVEIYKIYSVLRKFKPATIRDAIKYLHSQGRIIMEVGTMSVTPVITEEEKPYTEPKKLWIDDVKIRECIRSFFRDKSEYPSSSDIVRKFIELFGVPMNDDPDRKVREMFESGKLLRTYDKRYYFKDMGSRERTLMGY